jgi:H+/gluconate symporter-like permease
MQVSDRMDVIEGSTWSGKLTSKFLTATERLKIAPDVGVLFALSTASKTVTSDTVSELQADPYLCHLALSHQTDNVFAPNAAMSSSVFDTDCFSRRLR